MRGPVFVCIMTALVIEGGAFAVATVPRPADKPAPADVIRAKRIELTDDQGSRASERLELKGSSPEHAAHRRQRGGAGRVLAGG